MAIQTRESIDAAAMVDELLRTNSAANTADLLESVATAYIALGVIEFLLGLLALGAPFAASAFFALLLGAAVLAGGIVGVVSSAVKRSWGRFILGAAGIVAGALLMAHPVFNLNFMTVLLGTFLIIGGIGRLVSGNESGWMAVSGFVSFLLGILIFAGWPSTSRVALGIYVAASLIIGGVATAALGNHILRRISRTV